jgi:hypothetical protein
MYRLFVKKYDTNVFGRISNFIEDTELDIVQSSPFLVQYLGVNVFRDLTIEVPPVTTQIKIHKTPRVIEFFDGITVVGNNSDAPFQQEEILVGYIYDDVELLLTTQLFVKSFNDKSISVFLRTLSTMLFDGEETLAQYDTEIRALFYPPAGFSYQLFESKASAKNLPDRYSFFQNFYKVNSNTFSCDYRFPVFGIPIRELLEYMLSEQALTADFTDADLGDADRLTVLVPPIEGEEIEFVFASENGSFSDLEYKSFQTITALIPSDNSPVKPSRYERYGDFQEGDDPDYIFYVLKGATINDNTLWRTKAREFAPTLGIKQDLITGVREAVYIGKNTANTPEIAYSKNYTAGGNTARIIQVRPVDNTGTSGLPFISGEGNAGSITFSKTSLNDRVIYFVYTEYLTGIRTIERNFIDLTSVSSVVLKTDPTYDSVTFGGKDGDNDIILAIKGNSLVRFTCSPDSVPTVSAEEIVNNFETTHVSWVGGTTFLYSSGNNVYLKDWSSDNTTSLGILKLANGTKITGLTHVGSTIKFAPLDYKLKDLFDYYVRAFNLAYTRQGGRIIFSSPKFDVKIDLSDSFIEVVLTDYTNILSNSVNAQKNKYEYTFDAGLTYSSYDGIRGNATDYGESPIDTLGVIAINNVSLQETPKQIFKSNFKLIRPQTTGAGSENETRGRSDYYEGSLGEEPNSSTFITTLGVVNDSIIDEDGNFSSARLIYRADFAEAKFGYLIDTYYTSAKAVLNKPQVKKIRIRKTNSTVNLNVDNIVIFKQLNYIPYIIHRLQYRGNVIQIEVYPVST